jgi:biopolymer transport protein ExbD
MATATGKARCVTCNKEKTAVRCEACQQIFCRTHLTDHYQALSEQLYEIEINRDLFQQTLKEQTNHPQKHFLIKQIDQWEYDSIQKIQQTAKECRQMLLEHTTEHFNKIEINLTKLTDQLRKTRQENDFNEIDLNHLKHKLTQLTKDLDNPPGISIQEDSKSFINKISIGIPSGKCINSI